jgi:hypothetical protein
VGIRTKIEGDNLYLIDVELADTSRAGRLGPMDREKRLAKAQKAILIS